MKSLTYQSCGPNPMFDSIRLILPCALSSLLCLILPTPISLAGQESEYSQKIQPILDTYCVACHNQEDSEGGLRLDSYAQLIKGGETGPAITAGSASSSRLFLMANNTLEPVMPPDDADGPTADELAVLAEWIDAGAIAPSGETVTQFVLRTPKIEVADHVKHPITAMACAANGKLIATATFQGVTISDLEGNNFLSVNQFPGKINSLHFTADSSKLVVGSGLTGVRGHASVIATNNLSLPQKTQAKIVPPQPVATVAKLVVQGHSDTIYSAVMSPDQTKLATAGYDKKIHIWDAHTGTLLQTLSGHNGAIFDLQFISDGQTLISASADETVKAWNVATGQRLDTLGQPEGEVYAVDTIQVDQKTVAIAISADNRLRVWELSSGKADSSAQLLETRFIDESPLVAMALTPDQLGLIVVSEAGNMKVLETKTWTTTDTIASLSDSPSDVAITADGKFALIALMNGTVVKRDLSLINLKLINAKNGNMLKRVYLESSEFSAPEEYLEAELPNNQQIPYPLSRHAITLGTIDVPGQIDQYCWQANEGEVWTIQANAINVPNSASEDEKSSPPSRLDPIIRIQNQAGAAVVRTRLQAIRDSYFTFRGKDSNQANDFRLFAWQEMNLNDYLYASGEVTKLWMHPRGPDSGFDVYPGEGNRWTYFGTSHVTHALGEPAYIVRPLDVGETPLANGLPVFEIPYQNDDDPNRIAGKNSRLTFVAPYSGQFTISVTDTRGQGGDNYGYELLIRPTQPSFHASCSKVTQPLLPGIGREFSVTVDRIDEFDEPIEFKVEGLPEGVNCSSPIIIEAGQRSAYGTLWIQEDSQWPETVEPKVIATATINGKTTTKDAGTLGQLTKAGTPKVKPIIQSLQNLPDSLVTDPSTQGSQPPILLQVRRGQTISARVIVQRQEGYDQEISFGNALAGRNTAHGVYVDNIGLNGLLLLKGMNQRDFSITAAPQAALGKRPFFLKAEVEGGLTTRPIILEVIP